MDLIVVRREGTVLSAFPTRAVSSSRRSWAVAISPRVNPARSASRGTATSSVRATRCTRSSRNSRTPPRSRHQPTRYQCSPPRASPSGSTARDDAAPLRSEYSIASTDRLHSASSAVRMTAPGMSFGSGSLRQMLPAIDLAAARSRGAITETSLCSAERAASANGVRANAVSATAVAIASRGEMFSGGSV